MRGADAMQENLFTVAKLEDFVPSDHPLRAIRVLVNDVALDQGKDRVSKLDGHSSYLSFQPEDSVPLG